MISIGSSWNAINKRNTLTWLFDAMQRMVRDSSRSTVDPSLRARIAETSRRFVQETEHSPAGRIESFLVAYESLRRALGENAYTTPPLDVTVPSITDDARGERPREIPASEWPHLVDVANRRLTPQNPLRDAIGAWATFAQSAPQDLPDQIQDIVNVVAMDLPDTIEWHRARRLAAWVNDRLISIGALNAVVGELPSPTPTTPTSPPRRSNGRGNGAGNGAGTGGAVAMPAPAPPPPPADDVPEKKGLAIRKQSNIATWIFVAGIVYIGWRSFRKRRRSERLAA